MCGLVGIAGHGLDLYQRQMFSLLLLFDQIRGTDSTGAAFVSNSKNIEIAKAIGHPFNLFETKKYDSLIGNLHTKVLLGHNRYKTVGEANLFNAHPFHYGDVVGAHNGTLTNWRSLNIDYSNINTDSQAIYTGIANLGLEETLANIKGAYALTYYDRATDTMNMIRNTERPLFYAYLEDRKAIVWASEEWMIWAAIDAVNTKHRRKVIDLEPFNSGSEDEEDTYVFSLPTDLHYAFKLPESGKPFGKPTVKFIEGGSKIATSNFPSTHGRRGAIETSQNSATPPRKLTGWFTDVVVETRKELGLISPVPLVSPFAAQGGKEVAGKIENNNNLNDNLYDLFRGSASERESVSENSKEGKKDNGAESLIRVDGFSIKPKDLNKVLIQGCRWCDADINFTSGFKLVSSEYAICTDCQKGSDYVHPSDLKTANVSKARVNK